MLQYRLSVLLTEKPNTGGLFTERTITFWANRSCGNKNKKSRRFFMLAWILLVFKLFSDVENKENIIALQYQHENFQSFVYKCFIIVDFVLLKNRVNL